MQLTVCLAYPSEREAFVRLSVCRSLTSLAQLRRSSSNTLYLQKCIFYLIHFSFYSAYSLKCFLYVCVIVPLALKARYTEARYVFLLGEHNPLRRRSDVNMLTSDVTLLDVFVL